jgi:hypothetical protein
LTQSEETGEYDGKRDRETEREGGGEKEEYRRRRSPKS